MKKSILLAMCLFGSAALAAPIASPANVSASTQYETKVERGVNFRVFPNTNSYIFRMIPKGEQIHIIEKVNRYWYKIQVQDGATGFISTDPKYTNYNSTDTGSANSGTIIRGVNFRSTPKPSGSRIAFISKGSRVQVLGAANNWWTKIKYNGKIGYIDSDYVSYSGKSGSGSSAGSGSNAGSAVASSKADRIIADAKSLIGRVTYDFGTRNPSRLIFDCSSFTEFVFEKSGVELKWGTRYQQYAGSAVSKSNLKKGDLVFFGTSNRNVVNHVGIYIGNGQFIHNSPSGNVNIKSLNTGYWADRYIKARRVL